jgi:hypothetical protein
MTFDTRGHTMMGVSPETAAAALVALGVDAIGGNCGNGPDELLPVIAKMHAVAPDIPIVAKPNVGIPVFVGARAEYRTTPEMMAVEAASLRDGRGARRGRRETRLRPRSRPVLADRPAGRRQRWGSAVSAGECSGCAGTGSTDRSGA